MPHVSFTAQNGDKVMVKLISMDDLKKKIDAGSVTVVDALGQESYEQAHLPGAINIPVTEVDQKAPSMLPDKNAEIAVYCMSPT